MAEPTLKIRLPSSKMFQISKVLIFYLSIFRKSFSGCMCQQFYYKVFTLDIYTTEIEKSTFHFKLEEMSSIFHIPWLQSPKCPFEWIFKSNKNQRRVSTAFPWLHVFSLTEILFCKASKGYVDPLLQEMCSLCSKHFTMGGRETTNLYPHYKDISTVHQYMRRRALFQDSKLHVNGYNMIYSERLKTNQQTVK